MYMLSPTDNYLDEYHINAVTGHLHLNSKKKDVVENDNYCIENFLLENSTIEVRNCLSFKLTLRTLIPSISFSVENLHLLPKGSFGHKPAHGVSLFFLSRSKAKTRSSAGTAFSC